MTRSGAESGDCASAGDDTSPRQDALPSFPEALSAAIEARGLPLERIRHHLAARGHQVTIATLSYWRTGRSRPERPSSLAALGALEVVLRVPRGSLARTLPGSRRQPAPDAPPPVGMDQIRSEDQSGTLDELVADIGLEWGRDIELISSHDLVMLDDDRRGGRHVVRQVLRSLHERLDRFPVSYTVSDEGTSGSINGLVNCHVGRTARTRSEGAVVAEMLLDAPLRLGDSVSVEFELVSRNIPVAYDSFDRGVLRPIREVYIEVEFQPHDLPAWVSEWTSIDGQVNKRPLRLQGHIAGTLAVDFGPGVLGLNWGWND